MILESSRCTVYMLNQILSVETEDVGKQCGLLEVIMTEVSSASIFCICFSHKYWTQGEYLVKMKYSSQYNDCCA